jgi:galacturonosyltransferase
LKKNILILSNSIIGLFAFRKEVVGAMVEHGFRVWISSPDDDHDKYAYFRELGCEMVETPVDRRGTNPLRDLGLLRRYRRLLREVKPAAVLTYTIKPNVYGGMAARWAKVPLLANITGLGTAVENPGPLQKITVAMYRFALRKAETVFYQNDTIKKFCEENGIGRRGVLLPGSGVNLEWHALQPYPSQESPMRFLFVGRMMRDKGTDEFLEMAAKVKASHPQVEFHILGPCEDDYEARVAEAHSRGTVVWHGGVPDVRPYMREAWCTVHPSYHEGMANVLLESAAAGRPAITTDVPGCREAVEDGVTGFLCPVRDASALTAAVERFLQLPYDEKVRMGLAGREKMVREFDRGIVVRAYLDAL